MARTNTKRPRSTLRTHEGAPAVRVGANANLRRTLMACLLWEDSFYEDGISVADRIVEGVANVRPEVAAALAIEAREEMNLRHAPLLVAREMARGGGRIVGDTIGRIVQRPDELTEFVAMCFESGMPKSLTPQVKRGLALAFGKFDEYQLAKYDRKDRVVRLRDVLRLVHPKPKDAEQAALWARLRDGELATPNTWETRLSSGEDKRTVWESLIEENALGGLALLRNLRNMQSVGVPISTIRGAIEKANFRRVLPFRFIAAARFAPTLVAELEEAMTRACADLPKLPGRTALLLDNSGSMYGRLSAKSDLDRTDAAGGLGILFREVCEEALVVGFGSDAAVLPSYRGFALADAYKRGPGGGTNTETAKRLADSVGYDRIVVLTDEQSHQKISAPKGLGYVVNLATYRNGIGYGPWTHIDGWSESVVRYVLAAETEEAPE